eukprot:scaffold67027_cov18-Prasinocladus_malaysianus.AAC.2
MKLHPSMKGTYKGIGTPGWPACDRPPGGCSPDTFPSFAADALNANVSMVACRVPMTSTYSCNSRALLRQKPVATVIKYPHSVILCFSRLSNSNDTQQRFVPVSTDQTKGHICDSRLPGLPAQIGRTDHNRDRNLAGRQRQFWFTGDITDPSLRGAGYGGHGQLHSDAPDGTVPR